MPQLFFELFQKFSNRFNELGIVIAENEVASIKYLYTIMYDVFNNLLFF